MACGTTGNLFKNAPIVSNMVATLIDNCEAGNNHDKTPLIYCMPYTERSINVGFYS